MNSIHDEVGHDVDHDASNVICDTTLFDFFPLPPMLVDWSFFFGVSWLVFSSLTFIISLILSKKLNVVRIKQWVDLQ
jgi:hypothetical protein